MPQRAPSRRALMSRAAAVALAPLFTPLPDRKAWAQPRFFDYPFKLGVASGDPLPDGVVIWTRLAPDPFSTDALPHEPIEVEWQVAEDDGMRRTVQNGMALARPEFAHAVHVELTDLKPGREYFYQFRAGGEVSPVGRTLTAPSQSANVKNMKFAFASCQHYEHGYFTAYRDMIAQDPSLIIHLGDYIYEYAMSRSPVRRHPVEEAYNLEDYRALHAAYKLDPDLRAAHAYAPWVCTWDDHEVENNYADDQPEFGEPTEEFLRRRTAAYRAYFEHLPLRLMAEPQGPRMRIHQRFQYGDLAEFSVLDLRQFRDPQACEPEGFPAGAVIDLESCPEASAESRSLMGREQEFWFNFGFGRGGSTWNVIAQSLMMAGLDQLPGPGRGVYNDNWGGYMANRQRIVDLIMRRGVENVVSLGGDIHGFWVSDITEAPFDPNSTKIGTEFVCTSVTSPSFLYDTFSALLPENPQVKLFEDRIRGYVMCDLTQDRWRSTLRTVSSVLDPDPTFGTLATFDVESGTPGPVRV